MPPISWPSALLWGAGWGRACPASASSPISPVFLHSSPDAAQTAYLRNPSSAVMRVLGTEVLVWETEWRTTGGLTPVTLFPATATSRGTSMSRREAHSTSPGTWTWSRLCDPARRGRGGLRGGDPRGIPRGRGGCRGSLCWPHALHHDPATPGACLPHPESSPAAVPTCPARRVVPAGLGDSGQALSQDFVPQVRHFLLLMPQSGHANVPGWGLGGDPGRRLCSAGGVS